VAGGKTKNVPSNEVTDTNVTQKEVVNPFEKEALED